MALGFASGAKRGQHYDLAMFSAHKLKSVNLLVKGQSEKHFEMTVVSHLQASSRLRKNLITQIGVDEVQKITQASFFGFSHRPDISIGNDGTAIEIKVITSGQSVRDVLGQALAYRMHYRFVVLVLIDQTEERQIVNTCRVKGSSERLLLCELADTMNIFTIIGPLRQSRNIVFSGRRQPRNSNASVATPATRTAQPSSPKQVKAEQSAPLDAGQKAIRPPGTSAQTPGPRK